MKKITFGTFLLAVLFFSSSAIAGWIYNPFTGKQDYYNTAAGSGDLVSTNNLSDIDNVSTALDNLFTGGYTWGAVALDFSASTVTFGLEAGDIPDISASYDPAGTAASAVSALQADDLVTLSGVAIGSTHLGTFTGTIITDNQTIKAAIQLLETAIEGIEVGGLSDLDDLPGDTVDDNLIDFALLAPATQIITDNAVLTVDQDGAADNDYAKFTANGLEGRSYSEVRSDLGLDSAANLESSLSLGAFASDLLGYANAAAVLSGIGAQASNAYLADIAAIDSPSQYDMIQFDGTDWVKVSSLTGLNFAGFTANRAIYSDASGILQESDVTDTELGYLDDVTSAIQTQLNAIPDTAFASLTAGDTYTNFGDADDDTIDELFAAVDTAIGLLGSPPDENTVEGYIFDADAESITGVWTIGTDVHLQFRDAAIYINSGADGYLDLEADTGIRFNGPVTFANEGAITLPANSVDSDQYVDGSIDNAHLADDAVDSDEIASGAIDLDHMSANSVDSDQYVDGSIDNVHLADNAVDSDELTAGSVDATHLAVGALLPTVISGDPDSLDDTLSTNPKLYDGGYIRYNAAGEATLDAFTTAGQNVSIQFYPSVAIIVNPNASQTITLNGVAIAQGEALINSSNFGMCVLTYLGTNSIDAVCGTDITEETP